MTIDLKALAAPFPQDRISWRAGMATNGKALALAYIDARDVQDRLDTVCGPENWQNRYTHATDKKTVCEIGIRISGEWIWKADGAGDSDIEAEKGALSDAFKRAAVKWGIGRYLYDLDSPWVPCEMTDKGKFRRFTDDPWKYVKGARAAPPPPPKQQPGYQIVGETGTILTFDTPTAYVAGLETMLKSARNRQDAWEANKATARLVASQDADAKAKLSAIAKHINEYGKEIAA